MDVICLEETAFYTLVEQTVARIQDKLGTQDFKWIAPEKAMQLLNITSTTTLQKLRDEGKIRFSQPQKKMILYDKNSIDLFLEKHARETF